MLENMLDYLRIALYTLLIALCFLVFQAWDKDHPKETYQNIAQTAAAATDRYLPTAPTQKMAQTAVETGAEANPASQAAAGQIVKVKTDTLEISIDTRGGDIIEAKLLKYDESLGSQTPFVLFNNDSKTRYIAESGLVGKEGPDTKEGQALYTTSETSYELAPGQNNLVVKLNWQNRDGVKVTKLFTFVRDSYEIKVGYEVDNASKQPWEGSLYTQLSRTDNPPPSHGGLVNLATYFGAAVSTPQKPFDKVDFSSMKEKKLDQEVKGGWAAMIQHYFISAWVPEKEITSRYYSSANPQNGLYTIGMIEQPQTVQPGGKWTTQAKLYAGPAIADKLEKTAPGLKLTIDYGWFWMISGVIFYVMQLIYDVVGNWGWSIVIVTIIIKLLFYHLSSKSYRSMSALKRLQPRIESLKEKFGNDRQKLTQATLELYRQEKVNPMSGCLPILVQIPVFIALYWVLIESVELRQAPFILWIHDLSQHDPYYILPVLMGLSMFVQQRLNPPPPDPMQAKIMMLMPVVFTVLFANFPAGLMLYWFVNNTLSFMQQWYIMLHVEKAASKKK